MLELFRAGGFPMYGVLIFGLIAIVTAARFARNPRLDSLAVLRALTVVEVTAIVTATAADLAAVGTKVPARPEWAHSPDLPLIVMQGFAESMSPTILGGTLLVITWLFAAIALRRRARA